MQILINYCYSRVPVEKMNLNYKQFLCGIITEGRLKEFGVMINALKHIRKQFEQAWRHGAGGADDEDAPGEYSHVKDGGYVSRAWPGPAPEGRRGRLFSNCWVSCVGRCAGGKKGNSRWCSCAWHTLVKPRWSLT